MFLANLPAPAQALRAIIRAAEMAIAESRGIPLAELRAQALANPGFRMQLEKQLAPQIGERLLASPSFQSQFRSEFAEQSRLLGSERLALTPPPEFRFGTQLLEANPRLPSLVQPKDTANASHLEPMAKPACGEVVCGDEDSFRHIVGEIVKESAKKAAEECLKNPDSCRRIAGGDGRNR